MQTTDAGRRRALLALTGMGLGALAPRLDALVTAAPAGAEPVTIDAHCHILNARDMPGKEFLLGPVRNDAVAMGVDPWLIVSCAGLITVLANFLAPTAMQELQWLQSGGRLSAHALDALNKKQKEKFSRRFAALARSDRIFNELFAEQLRRWNLQRSQLLGDAVKPPPSKDPGNPDHVLLLLNQDDAEGVTQEDEETLALWKALGRVEAKVVFNPWNLVKFMAKVTSWRILNLRKMQRTYSGRIGPKIDLFCPSMLDFDYWLGDGSENEVQQNDGIALMEQIAVSFGGAILPLVAFNPAADELQHGRALTRVRDAVEKKGFIGVKIYPPNGYRPSGNVAAATAKKDECPPLAEAAKINARLENLYDWAYTNQVPVMSHTSHFIGASQALEECAEPMGWNDALAKILELRIQAAHFGGDHKVALGEYWAKQLVEMLGAYPNLHVDLADMSGLFGSDKALADLYNALLVSCLPQGGIVADRLLYGSDFYMTDMQGATRIFAGEMYKFVAALPVAGPCAAGDVMAKVFGQNAVGFYGLARGGANKNRDRIDAFYRKRRIATPEWMKKVDAP